MKKKLFLWLLSLWLAMGTSAGAKKLNVVILTGRNNHDWQATTPALKGILEQSGKFHVDVVTEPEQLTERTLNKYDVLLSNWNNWNGDKTGWTVALKRAYTDFVQSGGGHVVVHAGSSSFFDWKDYHKICCTTWKPGQTNHGPPHEFDVRPTEEAHPITQGLKPFKIKDELWIHPHIQPGVTILAEAYSDLTKDWEPIAMVNTYGEGRCFTLLLGHGVEPMMSAGFKELLLRGTEWAATVEFAAAGTDRRLLRMELLTASQGQSGHKKVIAKN